MRQQYLNQAKRLVIKIGSSLVASRQEGLRMTQLQRLASEVTALLHQGLEIIVVSSGAIVAGIEQLQLKTYPQTLPLKQACAATGQSCLIHAYEKCFHDHEKRVALVLLTHQDLADRKRFLNARHTLNTLIQHKVIPIINENDTVSIDEIQFGDNDTLAGQVAHLVDADLLVILSDVDGLFTEDPSLNPSAELISTVESITNDILQRAGTSRNQESRGGMATKVEAARHAAQFGVPTLIMNGEHPGLLETIPKGTTSGTVFFPCLRPLPSRKHWIAFTLRSKGQLFLDDGAVEALRLRGKSLLPSGILDVKGNFLSGDPVSCVDPHQKEFARGLANYSSETLQLIKGHKTAEVAKILVTQEYEEVIHRDNLALL
jgi:glutamate 5-kinase